MNVPRLLRFIPHAPTTLAALTVAAAPGVASAQTCADHGVPFNGYPKWQERAMHVLTNACRIAPQAYRSAYLPSATNILLPANYPAVAPLQWHYGLNQVARNHSTDLASTSPCGFQHDSCNGTPVFTRIAAYYPNWATMGENIAAGTNVKPLDAINNLLLDNIAPNTPAADRSANDGHRQNIMSSNFTQVGNGYAFGPNTYRNYYTQDFGRPQGSTTICSPIAAGSHLVQSTQVNFLINYYDAATTPVAPQSAQIFINGVATPLTLYLGTPARGTYKYTTTAGSVCRSYHFEFRNAAGTLFRYPTRGELRTFSEGGCTEDYTTATTTPPCPADFNNSGAVSIDDFFMFLNAWLAGSPTANFNGTGGVTIDDLFMFLNTWLAGC